MTEATLQQQCQGIEELLGEIDSFEQQCRELMKSGTPSAKRNVA
jgi:hypothetical protein